jgi:hypothetical protein
MVKRFAVPFLAMCLLGVCGAFCQEARPSSVKDRYSHNFNKTSGRMALPDAPSTTLTAVTNISQSQRKSDLSSGTAAFRGDAGSFLPPRPTLAYESVETQKEPGAFFRKYLDTSFLKQEMRYRASSKETLMGRATDAAARIFVTRDDSGRRRLNTSYFVSVLTSVAVHSASRPYWARSSSMPLSDFGSTVGNDAGMNLMHEFGPGLRQAVTGHMPRIMFRMEKRIIRNANPQFPIAGR